MNGKVGVVVAILAIFSLLAFPQQAQATPVCSSEISFTTPSSSLELGQIFNAVLSTTSPPPANPSQPWLPYNNATLDLTSGLVNKTGSLFADLSILSDSSVTWQINSTSSGSKLLNLTVVNSTGAACEKTLSVNIADATDPVIQLTTDNKTTVPANKPFTYQVNLNNTGNENATSITIDLDVFESNITPSIPLSISPIPNGTSSSQSFSITPLACREYELTTIIKYYDTNGIQKTNIQSLDQYVANSSDLLLNAFSLSASSVTEGGSVTFTVQVKNIGEKNSTGFNVTFYKNSVASSNKLATATSNEELAYLQTRNVTATWSASGTDTTSIIAVADSFDGDCNLGNTQKNATITVTAVSPTNNNNGGNPPSPSPTILNTACTYKWECGDWSICSNQGKQTRTCLNKGTCTGVEGKPEETQSCAIVVLPVEETQKLEKLEAGSTGTLTFTKDVSIQEIVFTAKDSISNVDVKVKTLATKPKQVEQNVSGLIYKYLEISQKNLEGKIEKATVKFKLEKEWVDINKADKNKVVLNRFTDKWDKLATKLVSEDNTTLFYEAETPGFSFFAISAEEASASGDAVNPDSGSTSPATGFIIGGSTTAAIIVVVAVIIAIAILVISGKRNRSISSRKVLRPKKKTINVKVKKKKK
ncbi:MAG: PGF-pre-PGF domain-containing protein [Candidatus Aenigmarchaeota archaeon]|nr:PGF-pre-PGF domain-containing protein [Candidatus Aenigmarchaeota archaeon]